MAGSVKLTPFYFGLAVIVIVGGALIWRARDTGGGATEVGPVPVATDGFAGYMMGSDSAPVEIVEFADFQCPACARFAILTAPDVKERLINTGLVRLRFRDMPLSSHPNAPAAHHAAACADEQGRFWEMHDQLFFNQRAWASERRPAGRLRGYARAIGLDVGRYDDCMASNRYVARIASGPREAAEVGIGSTPSFVIGGTLVVGAVGYDSVETLVNRAVAAAGR